MNKNHLSVEPSIFIHGQEQIRLYSFNAYVSRRHGRELHYTVVIYVIVRSGYRSIGENQNIVSVSAVQFHPAAIVFERTSRCCDCTVRFTGFPRAVMRRRVRIAQWLTASTTRAEYWTFRTYWNYQWNTSTELTCLN